MAVQWRSRLALIATLSVLLPAGTPAGSGTTEKMKRLDPVVTASIPRAGLLISEATTENIAVLKRGLGALASGDVAEARKARALLSDGSLDRHILSWAIAVGGGLTSAEIADAVRNLPGWPGLEVLSKNAERALYREDPEPKLVLGAFAGKQPQTTQGVILLSRAHVALGNRAAAQETLTPFWRTAKLEAADEMAILKEFGSIIPQADHRFRMERMLYAERVKSAERVASLAGAEQLQKAWAAVVRGQKDASKLLDAVPSSQRSAGYYFALAKHLRRAEKFSQAAQAMAKAPTDASQIADPDAWWIERRVLSRELMDAGDIRSAYQVAASHSAESPLNAVDAEFHAGWYALRGLKDTKSAAKHFARIAELADGPISTSRAQYWLGRTAEAAGNSGEAKTHFMKAAAYGTAFYGQLAAQRIGLSSISVPHPTPSEGDRRSFAVREPVRALGRLEAAGYQSLADKLYRDLADQLTNPGELSLLAAKAVRRGDHFLALRVGKAAARRGIDIGSLAHPVGAIPSSANITEAGQALAYAVARQESEFNIGAVSKAGALGLLQLMPSTAKDIAKRQGLPFSKTRLTTDAGYNATLGTAFLGEQLGRFKGSYVLTFAGYNAGPTRASQWIKRYGDPRGKEIDTVVDWIERIPFAETRAYVQRVMENYQVYKMRLTGKFSIVDDLVNGRR